VPERWFHVWVHFPARNILLPVLSVLRFTLHFSKALLSNQKESKKLDSLEEYYVLEYDTVCSGRNLPSSGGAESHGLRASNSEPSKQVRFSVCSDDGGDTFHLNLSGYTRLHGITYQR
jgi:hypothetical protein